MRNKINLSIITLTAVMLTPLVSCSAPDSLFKDGYYNAEAAEFDSSGWKDYITICVSGGRIILVEFNAFNKAGFLKSWDMNYMRAMKAAAGTYPSEYTRHYGQKMLLHQGTQGVDVFTGATKSHHIFLQLAQAVLENARIGEVSTRVVLISEPGSR